MLPTFPPYSSRRRPSMDGTYPAPAMSSSDPDQEAVVNQSLERSAIQDERNKADFRATQQRTADQLAQQQAPGLAATAARKSAQEAAGIDKDASPEMAARQLAAKATSGIADPVDAVNAAAGMGLDPDAMDTNGPDGGSAADRLNAGLTSALQTTQANRAGQQTTALDDAYARGRKVAGVPSPTVPAPIPGTQPPPPLTGTITAGTTPIPRNPNLPVPPPPLVKPIKPTKPINSRRLTATPFSA